jgi:hypothetical protein
LSNFRFCASPAPAAVAALRSRPLTASPPPPPILTTSPQTERTVSPHASHIAAPMVPPPPPALTSPPALIHAQINHLPQALLKKVTENAFDVAPAGEPLPSPPPRPLLPLLHAPLAAFAAFSAICLVSIDLS